MELYYYDTKGRRYIGKERTCPSCGKKEIIRDSNNSLKCKECCKSKLINEIDYIDVNGDKYPGRIKKCLGCGKESIVRSINKTEYCRKCILKKRKNSIKDDEIKIVRSNGRISRGVLLKCEKCGKERIARKDSLPKGNLCVHCRSKSHFEKLGKKWGGWNYSNGIGTYRNKKLNLFKKECECCGIDDKMNAKIVVHHKNEDRNDNNLDNLLILCQSCHQAIHFRIRKGYTIDEAFETVKIKKIKFPNKWGGLHLPTD